MIEPNNKKDLPLFLSNLAAFVAMGDKTVGTYDPDLDGWYLGGGYWRAKTVREVYHDPDSPIKGVILLNPDKTWLERQIVEKAACICLLGRYVGVGLQEVPESGV